MASKFKALFALFCCYMSVPVVLTLEAKDCFARSGSIAGTATGRVTEPFTDEEILANMYSPTMHIRSFVACYDYSVLPHELLSLRPLMSTEDEDA